MVVLLMSYGADPSIFDGEGQFHVEFSSGVLQQLIKHVNNTKQ